MSSRSAGVLPNWSVVDVTAQLERILTAPDFANSQQLSDFLRYVVERSLAGEGGRLKGYTIAIEALGRSDSFDPRTDPIVRVVATRVRKALDYYYIAFGKDDPILITIPRGTYEPTFEHKPSTQALPASNTLAKVASIPTEEHLVEDSHTQVATVKSPLSALDSRWWYALCGLLLVAIVGLGWLWPSSSQQTNLPVMPKTGPRIAVMPFSNASSDESLDVFVRGLSFELVSALARVRTLSVFADTSSKDDPENQVFGDLPTKLQGVDYVLQGMLRSSGDTIAIDHILLDARTAQVAWTGGRQVDLNTADFLAVQQDVVQAVIGELSGGGDGVILDLELARSDQHTGVSVEAYRCVLSMHEYWRTFAKVQHASTRACLEKTVERFPNYALAHARLAAIYLDEYKYGTNSRTGYDPIERAYETVNQSLGIDPDSLQARNTLFNIEMARGHTDKALEIGRALISDNPNDPVFLANFGSKLGYGLGQWDEGNYYALRALDIVRNPPAWYFIAPAYYAIDHGNFDDALAFAKRMNDHLTASAVISAIAYSQRKDRSKTLEYLNKLAERDIVDADSLADRMKRWTMSDALKEKVLDYMRDAYSLAADS